jgi:hypothetical protein
LENFLEDLMSIQATGAAIDNSPKVLPDITVEAPQARVVPVLTLVVHNSMDAMRTALESRRGSNPSATDVLQRSSQRKCDEEAGSAFYAALKGTDVDDKK